MEYHVCLMDNIYASSPEEAVLEMIRIVTLHGAYCTATATPILRPRVEEHE